MPSKPGWLFHKPGCKCRPCAGKAKALAVGAGGEGDLERDLPKPAAEVDPKQVIHANHPYDPKKHGAILIGQDRTVRGRIREWLKHRTLNPAMSNADIAAKLGIGVTTLNSYICRAAREGWLKFDDPLERIEHEIIPQVVDNLNHFLKAKDRTVTIETAKGVLFPTFQASKGVNQAPITVLALKIESIDPSQVKAITGHIVGVPRSIEGEVEEFERS